MPPVDFPADPINILAMDGKAASRRVFPQRQELRLRVLVSGVDCNTQLRGTDNPYTLYSVKMLVLYYSIEHGAKRFVNPAEMLDRQRAKSAGFSAHSGQNTTIVDYQ